MAVGSSDICWEFRQSKIPTPTESPGALVLVAKLGWPSEVPTGARSLGCRKSWQLLGVPTQAELAQLSARMNNVFIRRRKFRRSMSELPTHI